MSKEGAINQEPRWLRIFLPILLGTLPFTYAFTVDIGFPLKIYELMAALIFIFFVCYQAKSGKFKVMFRLTSMHHIFISLVVFLVSYFISALVGIYLFHTNFDVFPSWAIGLNGPVVRSLLKVGYLFLSGFVFLIIVQYVRNSPQFYLNAFLLGALLASIYSIYLFSSGLWNQEPYFLPGIDPAHSRIGLGSFTFVRHGTFKEGNHFSLYLVLSAILAIYGYERFHQRLYLVLGLIFLAAIGATFSTTGLLLAVILVGCYALGKIITIKNKKRRGMMFFWGGGSLILLSIWAWNTPYGQLFFRDKLIGRGDYSHSRSDRLRQADFGFKLFEQYPVTGVGPNNYGLYYAKAHQVDGKWIANNIYSEVLAEGGILVFVPFLIFLFFLFSFLFRRRNTMGNWILMLGLGLIAVGWMAYPSFIVMFLWSYFGLSMAFASSNVKAQSHDDRIHQSHDHFGRMIALPLRKSSPVVLTKIDPD